MNSQENIQAWLITPAGSLSLPEEYRVDVLDGGVLAITYGRPEKVDYIAPGAWLAYTAQGSRFEREDFAAGE